MPTNMDWVSWVYGILIAMGVCVAVFVGLVVYYGQRIRKQRKEEMVSKEAVVEEMGTQRDGSGK